MKNFFGTIYQYTHEFAFLFVCVLVKLKKYGYMPHAKIVYESVVTKGSCDKNKVQKKFVGDLFLSPSPEGGRKE